MLDAAAEQAAGLPVPRAARRKRAPKTPLRWEYHVEFLSRKSATGWYQPRENVEMADLERRLNELGAEGWELVDYGPSPLQASSSPESDPRMIGIFKRPARDETAPGSD